MCINSTYTTIQHCTVYTEHKEITARVNKTRVYTCKVGRYSPFSTWLRHGRLVLKTMSVDWLSVLCVTMYIYLTGGGLMRTVVQYNGYGYR